MSAGHGVHIPSEGEDINGEVTFHSMFITARLAVQVSKLRKWDLTYGGRNNLK